MSSSNNNSTVQFSVDASGAEAGVNKLRAASANANAAMDSMAQRAALVDSAMREAAANGFELSARAANKLAAEYQKLADTSGKTQAQILAQKTANTGVTSTFAGLQAQIDAAGKSTHGFSLETSAAKRELLVLAHELSQGNYKRFGGSMLVLGEQTGAAGLLFSAAGLGALGLGAGIAGAAYQVIKGIESFNELKASVQATNDYVGLTTSQLQDMATKLAGTSSTIDATTSVIAQLVASGRVAGDTLSLAAQAAVDFGKQTGMASDEAVKAMVKFAEDPAKAIADLQGKYHEFSGAQVDVIEGFIKQGNTQAAVAAGYQAIVDNSAAMTPKLLADEGLIEGSYDGWIIKLKAVASYLQSIGRTATSQQLIADATTNAAEAQTRYNAALAKNPNGFDTASAKKALDYANDQLAIQKKVQEGAQNAADANAARAKQGDATLAAHQFIDNTKYANPADKHQLELDENKKNFEKATKDLDTAGSLYAEAVKRNNDNIAQINAEYAKKTKTRTVSPNAGINAALATIAGQNKLIEAEEKRSETRLKALKDLGVIDADTYYQQLHDIQSKALDGEIANAQQRADVAGGKREKAAQQTALAEVTKLTAQRKALDDDLNDALAKSAQQRNEIIRRYGETAASAYRDQLAGYKESFDTKDMLPIEKASYDARANLLATFVKNQESVESAYKSHSIDLATRDAELAISQETYGKQRAALEANLKQEQAIRDSFGDQAHHALIQLAGESQSNAQLAATAFTTAWGDASNALDTFVTKGTGSFSDFTSSVLADMAKIALHAAESQIFSSIASSSFFSAGGSVGHFATGGSISGPGTGTSDSIPAMLSDGEYVVNAASTKKYGSLLESINSGRMSHYASGGAVGSVPASPGPNSTHLSLSLGAANSGLTQEDLVALAPQIQNLVDKRLSQRMTGQGGFADRIRQRQI